MRIILIQEPGEDRDKLSFTLESKYRIAIDTFATAEEALKTVNIFNSKFLVLPLFIYFNTKVPLPVRKATSPKAELIPLIICSQKDTLKTKLTGWKVVGIARFSSLVTDLYHLIDSYLKLKGIEHMDNSDNDFVRIRTNILLSVCPLKGDIFIRLSKTKFVKLFHKGDTFEHSDWLKYTAQKKVEYLQIQAAQCQEFVEKYRIDLENKLSNGVPENIEQACDTLLPGFETVKEVSKKLGFSKEVQALVRTQIDVAVKAMTKTPRLSKLMKKLKSQNAEYIPVHSTLTGFLACTIASQMSWGSESTFIKLNLAAFLHDITLENQNLARCKTVLEAIGSFSESDVQAYKDHPNKAADIARNFTEVPPDVHVIIHQHHECSDGSGFPRKIGYAYIAPLACVFIVAHEIADEILADNYEFDTQDFINRMGGKYSHGGFKKVLQVVSQLDLESEI